MTDEIDEEILLGASPELDQSFDYTIGGDGDIAIARGSDELQKDLAFNAAFFLDPLVGLLWSKANLVVSASCYRSIPSLPLRIW